MRILLLVGEGVVLAVDRCPLPGTDAGEQPDGGAKADRQPGGEGDGLVGQVPVQVDGRGDVCDLREDEPDEQSDENGGQNARPFDREAPSNLAAAMSGDEFVEGDSPPKVTDRRLGPHAALDTPDSPGGDRRICRLAGRP